MADSQKMKEIEDIFSRGVADFIDPDKKFREKLTAKAIGEYDKPIIIKFGIDPTRPDIHLGHAVVFRKLRKFQDLGCKIVFVAGDFTTLIGDPTGKDKIRPEINFNEVQKNVETFLKQLTKVIRVEPDLKETDIFSWIPNSDWFFSVTDIVAEKGSTESVLGQNVDANSFIGKASIFGKTRRQTLLGRKETQSVSLFNVLTTLRNISHQKLIGRDMFQKRLHENRPLFMHEMLYPVLQGIDSVALSQIYGSCDLEIGGSDQTFNMLMGRTVMENDSRKPEAQAVLAVKLLEGVEGKEKMSKSLGNYIAINDEPSDMYGKVMSIPDESVLNYFELCAVTPHEEARELLKNENPKDVKMQLAREIVGTYYGDEKAQEAERYWVNTFSKKEIPENMEEIVATHIGEKLGDAFMRGGFVESNSDFRRLIEAHAITNLESGESVKEITEKIQRTERYKIGKKRFVKVILP